MADDQTGLALTIAPEEELTATTPATELPPSQPEEDAAIIARIQALCTATNEEIDAALARTNQRSTLQGWLSAFRENRRLRRRELEEMITVNTRRVSVWRTLCNQQLLRNRRNPLTITPVEKDPEATIASQKSNEVWSLLSGKVKIIPDSSETLDTIHRNVREIFSSNSDQPYVQQLLPLLNHFTGVDLEDLSTSDFSAERAIAEANVHLLVRRGFKIYVRNGIAILGNADETADIVIATKNAIVEKLGPYADEDLEYPPPPPKTPRPPQPSRRFGRFGRPLAAPTPAAPLPTRPEPAFTRELSAPEHEQARRYRLSSEARSRPAPAPIPHHAAENSDTVLETILTKRKELKASLAAARKLISDPEAPHRGDTEASSLIIVRNFSSLDDAQAEVARLRKLEEGIKALLQAKKLKLKESIEVAYKIIEDYYEIVIAITRSRQAVDEDDYGDMNLILMEAYNEKYLLTEQLARITGILDETPNTRILPFPAPPLESARDIATIGGAEIEITRLERELQNTERAVTEVKMALSDRATIKLITEFVSNCRLFINTEENNDPRIKTITLHCQTMRNIADRRLEIERIKQQIEEAKLKLANYSMEKYVENNFDLLELDTLQQRIVRLLAKRRDLKQEALNATTIANKLSTDELVVNPASVDITIDKITKKLARLGIRLNTSLTETGKTFSLDWNC